MGPQSCQLRERQVAYASGWLRISRSSPSAFKGLVTVKTAMRFAVWQRTVGFGTAIHAEQNSATVRPSVLARFQRPSVPGKFLRAQALTAPPKMWRTFVAEHTGPSHEGPETMTKTGAEEHDTPLAWQRHRRRAARALG